MHLSDFPDRLSPMLVKELRQGLRTRSFIAVFLTLQALLGIILLTASASATSDHAGSSISGIIFVFFSIAVLIIQPLRGIGALSSEVKGNTIDMMVLTRLSAWRIVTGKWSAIVSQSALILVTIIPYLILRYFFGGMNLLGEIVLLGMIFFTSTALTAVTVGLSASGSVILRSVLPIVGLPIGAYILLMFLTFGSGIGQLVEFCALEDRDSWIALSLYIAGSAYLGFFFLSTGTSLIATYAENHSTLRRVIALATACIAAVVCSISSFTNPEIIIFVFVIILAPVFAVSLTEFAPLVSPVYRKFADRGPLGHLAGFFFFPGWPSGVFFCGLITVVAIVPLSLNSAHYISDDYTIASLACLGTLLFPAVLINLLRMKGPQRVSNYILLGIASCVLAMVLAGIAESMSSRDFLWLFVWMPPVIFVMQANSAFGDEMLLAAVLVIDAALFALLLILAQHAYRASISGIKDSLAGETGTGEPVTSTS